jgi:hypothetical protein
MAGGFGLPQRTPSTPEAIYHQRDPQNTPFCLCVEEHFEAFEQVYPERFERGYGFARIRSEHCRHEVAASMFHGARSFHEPCTPIRWDRSFRLSENHPGPHGYQGVGGIPQGSDRRDADRDILQVRPQPLSEGRNNLRGCSKYYWVGFRCACT